MKTLPLLLGFVPFHRDVIRVGSRQILAHLPHEPAHPGVVVNRLQRDIDMEAPGVRELWISRETQLTECDVEA